jgi:hypothetical protein
MALEPYEIVNGVTSLIFVIITITIGLTIALKYFQHKNVNLIYVGLALVILCEPWWPQAIAFVLHLITTQGLPPVTHFFIGYFFMPFGMIAWFIALTNLMYKNKRKQILIIISIIQALFIILFIVFMVLDLSLLMVLQGIDVDYGPILLAYIVPHLFIIVITGCLFGRESLRSDSPEIRLKGKFLIVAFISYIVGGFFSIATPTFIPFVILGRIISITSAFEVYCGFLMPEKVKNLFIKDK